MMNALRYPLVIVAALAVAPLLPDGRAMNEPPIEIHAAAGSNFVCVVNKISETPGQYCTYNAIRCPGSKTSLDHSNCDLMQGDCNNAMNDPNCFDIPEKVIEDPYGDYVAKDLATKGLTALQADAFVPKLFNDAKILSNQLAQINLPKNTIKVRLFLIKTLDSKKKFFQIVGQGVEVKSVKAPDLEIAYDPKVMHFNGKVCFLNLGSAKYTVILNTKVALK